MKKSNIEIIEKGLLTIAIRPESKKFSDFKSFLDAKVDSLSKEELEDIELTSLKMRMKSYLDKKISKKEIIGSGEFLKELLSNLKVRQNRFAEYLEIRPSNLSKILKGERRISFELSLILEQIFKIESSLWLRIQSKNRLLALPKKELQLFKKYKLKDLTKNHKKNLG